MSKSFLSMRDLSQMKQAELEKYATQVYERQRKAYYRATKGGIDPSEFGYSRPQKPGKNASKGDLIKNIAENYTRTGVEITAPEAPKAATGSLKHKDLELRSSITKEALKKQRSEKRRVSKAVAELTRPDRKKWQQMSDEEKKNYRAQQRRMRKFLYDHRNDFDFEEINSGVIVQLSAATKQTFSYISQLARNGELISIVDKL